MSYFAKGTERCKKSVQLEPIVSGRYLKYSKSGTTAQHSYLVRFNEGYWRAVLDAYIFKDLNKTRVQTVLKM